MTMSTTATETGTVSAYFPEKGFGFIRSDVRGAENLFVHANMLRQTGIEALERGDRVRFERVNDPRGFRAQGVQII
jgi:CspA family cold shock protein